jgi:hypothetical protein
VCRYWQDGSGSADHVRCGNWLCCQSMRSGFLASLHWSIVRLAEWGRRVLIKREIQVCDYVARLLVDDAGSWTWLWRLCLAGHVMRVCHCRESWNLGCAVIRKD